MEELEINPSLIYDTVAEDYKGGPLRPKNVSPTTLASEQPQLGKQIYFVLLRLSLQIEDFC